ncbi:MAG: sugar phosphate isomerase/epimerase [Actinobacteria bacterium]|nr:sugar phosphate isomerase/epimerase [Actinomycetota bacterium]
MLLKCISYWSLVGGLDQSKPIDEAFFESKKANFDGIELTIGEVGMLNINYKQNECEKIRLLAEKMNISLKTIASNILFKYSLTDNNIKVRKKALKYLKRMLKITKWIGAENLLVIPGAVDIYLYKDYDRVPYETCFRRSKEAISEVLSEAISLNINICIENIGRLNKFLLSPIEMRDFIDYFASERIGSYFDVGNVLYSDGYPEDWINILGKRIKAIHFKDLNLKVSGLNGFCNFFEGDVNWKAVMDAIRKIGYKGTITAEVGPQSEVLLNNTSKAMDKILGRGNHA